MNPFRPDETKEGGVSLPLFMIVVDGLLRLDLG